MILVLSLVGAGVLLAAAVGRMVRRPAPERPRDPHRGDIPPDQLAP